MKLRPSIEVCSLSILGALILKDRRTAVTIFSELCGIGRDVGNVAVENFQKLAEQDFGWFDRLTQANFSRVHEDPGTVMELLTQGFGLAELDAIDVILRLSQSTPGTLN